MSDEPESDIIHRQIDTEQAEPATAVAEIVADIEGKDSTEIPNLWECTDEVLQHLFSNPPKAEAQMQVEFSYESYRITVEQDGTTEFIKTE
ncbi:HalOD1 output domain-containing protein [Halorussus aquaticus]|uniref:HalOD1 output domain-containing protein n=1 Tax=Halorussus aquaticus TaxID=2953748 RepID=A0ABD5Q1P7_9EURY|nr:HalOD1 output domain-containing protein [Halorussus aquaticus]